jgi:hypothetical protein
VAHFHSQVQSRVVDKRRQFIMIIPEHFYKNLQAEVERMGMQQRKCVRCTSQECNPYRRRRNHISRGSGLHVATELESCRKTKKLAVGLPSMHWELLLVQLGCSNTPPRRHLLERRLCGGVGEAAGSGAAAPFFFLLLLRALSHSSLLKAQKKFLFRVRDDSRLGWCVGESADSALEVTITR